MRLLSFERESKGGLGAVVGVGAGTGMVDLGGRFADLMRLPEGDALSLAAQAVKGRTRDFLSRDADSQVGHDQAIVRPPKSTHLACEAEIAVVIGRPGRRISEADAWRHIADYAVVATDEIPANTVMTPSTRLNGEVMRSATTETMLHGSPRQIACLSTIAPMQPGDVIEIEVEVDRIGTLRNTIAEEE